jgi:hypothetical protein
VDIKTQSCVVLLLLLLGSNLTFASALTKNLKCYNIKSFDRDGDGYAARGAIPKSFNVLIANRYSCPKGYVISKGDCNDKNKEIHPYRSEVPFNKKDDNCNGEKDETSYAYSTNGFNNSQNGFNISVAINDKILKAQIIAGKISAKITYQKLGLSEKHQSELILIGPDAFESEVRGEEHLVTLRLANLQSDSVYRARVSFHKQLARRTKTIRPAGKNWYYTTTRGDLGKVDQARSEILLSAFKEYSNQQNGLVGQGSRVQPFGTKYGATYNEAWCSEFYSWNAATRMKKIGKKSNTSALKRYFGKNFYQDYGLIVEKAERADWLAMDTNDNGKKNHTGMFLAYDQAQDKFWTIEGNSGKRVAINKRNSKYIYGLGHIKKSQLKK